MKLHSQNVCDLHISCPPSSIMINGSLISVTDPGLTFVIVNATTGNLSYSLGFQLYRSTPTSFPVLLDNAWTRSFYALSFWFQWCRGKEVLLVIYSRFTRDLLEIYSRSTRSLLVIYSRSTRDLLVVYSWSPPTTTFEVLPQLIMEVHSSLRGIHKVN